MSSFEGLIGQWIGKIEGTNSGYTVLNVDSDRPEQGSLQVEDTVAFVAHVRLSVIAENIEGILTQFWAQAHIPEGAELPSTGIFRGMIQGDRMLGRWETNIGTEGTFDLQRAEVMTNREPDSILPWSDFRTFVLAESKRQPSLIFRGHSDSKHQLVTSFHRRGRRDITRYEREDVPRLCRMVEPVLNTAFNIADAGDHGCLLNLAQHHGYPTPLLDWTESPFIAAFFAFSQLEKTNKSKVEAVRVFVFDREAWPHNVAPDTGVILPVLAPLQLRAKGNPRVLPQQSVNVFSNVVDVEGFVARVEQERSRRFLWRIDIPSSERSVAMSELDKMGLSAAALFPGVDGLCRSLAEKWF